MNSIVIFQLIRCPQVAVVAQLIAFRPEHAIPVPAVLAAPLLHPDDLIVEALRVRGRFLVPRFVAKLENIITITDMQRTSTQI